TSAAAVGRPASSSSLSVAGGAGRPCAASRSKGARYSAFVRSDASAPPASSLATLARTLLWPAGNSEITSARPLNISQNRSLPTAASMLPPIPAPRPQPVGAQQRLPGRAEFLGPGRRLGPDHGQPPPRRTGEDRPRGRTPVAPDAWGRTCRSAGRVTSCPCSQRAAHSACGMLTNLVYSDPMRNPMGPPPSPADPQPQLSAASTP